MGAEAKLPLVAEEQFLEKRFYLDEFHEKTLLFAFAPGITREPSVDAFLGTARELMREDARVVVIVEDGETARRLESRFRRLASATLSDPLFPRPDDRDRRPTIVIDVPVDQVDGLPILMRLWELLRVGPIAVLRIAGADWLTLARAAVRLGGRLRVHKLVLADPEGGVGLSFLDEIRLETLLAAGEAEWAGLGHRRHLIETIREGLIAGIPSINLCTLAGLALELFTYEGSGTLFTLEDYCRVERLGIDDFREVERLLERGQRDGFLKTRTPEEIGAILFTGYGATIGSGHLAGVGSLLVHPYAPEPIGEVVALYTISRFKAEGVGARILGRILDDARALALRNVFAVTTEERAMGFFLRHGFERVTPDDVPAVKWRSYDTERLRRVAVFRRELS